MVNNLVLAISLPNATPIVTLDGLCLDDHTCVTLLVVLALRGHRPCHVAARHHYARQNDCHK